MKRNYYILAGTMISLAILLLVGCGSSPDKNAVYIKKTIWTGELIDDIGYVVLDGRKYTQSDAVTKNYPKELMEDFITEADGKKVVTNTFEGAKLYSVKGYDKRDRIFYCYEGDTENYGFLDCCDDEYISSLQDILNKFHCESTEEKIGAMLEEARNSECLEFNISDNPCADEPLRYIIHQKDGIESPVFIYPNGYLSISVVAKDAKVIYFKFSDKIINKYPEFFEKS